EERRGDLVSALDHWRQGIVLLPAGDPRLAPARERETALDKRIPRLSIALDASVPAGALVTLDGAPVARESAGASRPVNPGRHTVVISAPGRADWSTTVTLSEGQQSQ